MDNWHDVADNMLRDFQVHSLNMLGISYKRSNNGLISFYFRKELASPLKCLAVMVYMLEKTIEAGFIDKQTKPNPDFEYAINLFKNLDNRYTDEDEITIRYTSKMFLDCAFSAYEDVYYSGDPRPGYIYLIQAISPETHYKIGLSKNPVQRIASLGVKLPFPIEVKHLIKTNDMYAAEKQLHDKYASKRVNGEWFKLTRRDVKTIKRMKKILITGKRIRYPEDIEKMIDNKGIEQ